MAYYMFAKSGSWITSMVHQMIVAIRSHVHTAMSANGGRIATILGVLTTISRFIAGIRKSQRQELTVQGIHQLAEFAKADKPLPARPQRGSMESFVRVHRQAKVQYKGRLTGKPEFEFESVEDGRAYCYCQNPMKQISF